MSDLRKESAVKMHLLLMTTLATVGAGAALADPQPAMNSDPPGIVVIAPRTSPRYDPSQDIGSPGEQYPIGRIVQLGSKRSWVNVDYGQNVEFLVRDADGTERSLAWRFNGWPNTAMIHLSAFAPKDFVDHDVRVYIGPDPRYTGAGG
jgi:hypothetical protein